MNYVCKKCGANPRGRPSSDTCRNCGAENPFVCSRYPYTHHGPNTHGSKLADYLVSEVSLREDYPELFAARRDTGDVM